LNSGLSISGEEAYNAGLVSRLVPEQDIQTEVGTYTGYTN